MSAAVKWECPKCGADVNDHGSKKGAKACCKDRNCMGFICECESQESFDSPDHGTTPLDQCKTATCYCCGWGGSFPPLPFKLKGWAKTAWDAGWRPPDGWTPEA